MLVLDTSILVINKVF